MTKTNLGDDIFTIVFKEAWWKTIGTKIDHKTRWSFFEKQSRFKILDWFIRYILGIYVSYKSVVLTEPQQVEGGFEYYIRIVSKEYYIFWRKVKETPL